MSFVSEILTHCFPLNRNPPADAIDGAETTSGDGPDEFLRGDVALAAVLLDAVGASPADFKHGVHVIYAPSALSEGVKRAIAKTSGIDFCDVRAYRRPTDAMWVTSVFDKSTIITGLQAKATLIGVATSNVDLPSGFAAVADRIWSIPWVDRQHIEVAIRLMTGEAASLPNCQYHLSSVLKALRPGVGRQRSSPISKLSTMNDGPADEANASTALAEWRSTWWMRRSASIARMSTRPQSCQEGHPPARSCRLWRGQGLGSAARRRLRRIQGGPARLGGRR